MSRNRRDNDRIADHRKTSACRTSYLNLGTTPRVSASHVVNNEEHDGAAVALPDREPRKFLPSQQQILALLSRAVVPEERDEFEKRFREVATARNGEHHPDATCIGNTPLSWISWAYQCGHPFQLRHLGDMFPNTGMESEYLDEFYIIDVILNRCPSPGGNGINDDSAPPTPEDGETEDRVVLVQSYKPEDEADKNDFKFRAIILFLPQSGVFYCARERRDECVGVAKTLVPLDMSWLRLEREVKRDGSVSYTFGKGGYVKRMHRQHTSELIPENCSISAWRISTRRTLEFRQNRMVYRARQCSDSDGPMLAPDFFWGEDAGSWEPAYLAAEYNRRLARANSAKKDGRHYAPGCRHYRVPDTCLTIDPTVTHNVDIMVDVADDGQFRNRQSVVMIRNAMVVDSEDDRESDRYRENWDSDTHLIGALNHITFHNEVLRRRSAKGGARARGGDVGTMHAIGTHVDFDKVGTSPYAANGCVPERLLRLLVVSLSRIGRHLFPHVYSVVRDVESDSGLLPVPPMDGEGGCRVGYTIDMSINLGNSSHFDVHDASQGFSVWTEEIRGRGANWYFVMPNLHGMKPNGQPFAGIAIKLRHGVAISWDGRIIRHCTSLSKPDGVGGKLVGDGRNRFVNHLYGTFTAAKERVVQAGRLLAAAAVASRPVPPPLDSDVYGDEGDGPPPPKKRRRHRKKKKRRRGGAASVAHVGAVSAGAESVEAAAVSRLAIHQEVDGRLGTSFVADLVAQPAAAGGSVPDGSGLDGGVLSAEDLEVGGKYHIPKRKKFGWLH